MSIAEYTVNQCSALLGVSCRLMRDRVFRASDGSDYYDWKSGDKARVYGLTKDAHGCVNVLLSFGYPDMTDLHEVTLRELHTVVEFPTLCAGAHDRRQLVSRRIPVV